MSRTSLTIFNYERKKEELLCKLINYELHLRANHQLNHPLSRLIVSKTHSRYKLHTFILMWSGLRWKDCLELHIGEAVTNKFINIIQNKTLRKVRKNVIIYNKELEELLQSYSSLPDDVSYDEIRNSIKRVCRKYLHNYKMDFNHDTHIFRHLDASFLHSIGRSKSHIAFYLGHMDESIVDIYIHDQFKENKTLNN